MQGPFKGPSPRFRKKKSPPQSSQIKSSIALSYFNFTSCFESERTAAFCLAECAALYRPGAQKTLILSQGHGILQPLGVRGWGWEKGGWEKYPKKNRSPPTFRTEQKETKIRDYCAPAAVILLCAAAFRISWSVWEQKSISQAGASVTVLNATLSLAPSSMRARNVRDLFLFIPHFRQDEPLSNQIRGTLTWNEVEQFWGCLSWLSALSSSRAVLILFHPTEVYHFSLGINGTCCCSPFYRWKQNFTCNSVPFLLIWSETTCPVLFEGTDRRVRGGENSCVQAHVRSQRMEF